MSGDSAMGGGPLSDILKTVRLAGAAFFDVEVPRLMGRVIAAAQSDLAENLPGADRMIARHVVTAGRCSGTMAGEEAVALKAGEVIVFVNGDPHIMSSSPGMEALAAKQDVVECAAVPSVARELAARDQCSGHAWCRLACRRAGVIGETRC